MTHPGPHSGWLSPSEGHGVQPGWTPGQQWQQAPPGWQPAANVPWQQAGAWQQQGAWQRTPGPSPKSPLKKVLAIAVGAATAALVLFVVLLLVNRASTPGYEFEDYEAPPPQSQAPDQLMIPNTEEEALQLTQNNPIYDAVLPDNVNCEMPVTMVTEMDPQELQDHLNELTACLMLVWDRPTAEVGITLFRPSVTVYTSDITTQCGTVPGNEPNAFYCAVDQMLYYGYILHTHPATQGVGLTPFGVESVMAHEFGHFLQGRSGIFSGNFYLRVNAPSDEVQLEYSRRSELQADCLTGNWTRANQQSLDLDETNLAAVADVFAMVGDRQPGGDHGAPEMRRQWFLTGTTTANVSSCNTWIVPAEQVR